MTPYVLVSWTSTSQCSVDRRSKPMCSQRAACEVPPEPPTSLSVAARTKQASTGSTITSNLPAFQLQMLHSSVELMHQYQVTKTGVPGCMRAIQRSSKPCQHACLQAELHRPTRLRGTCIRRTCTRQASQISTGRHAHGRAHLPTACYSIPHALCNKDHPHTLYQEA